MFRVDVKLLIFNNNKNNDSKMADREKTWKFTISAYGRKI